MRGLPLIFVAAGVVCALVGMGWGIQMSATGDHTLSPAHAHLNLLGWVSLTLFGLYNHAVPQAAQGLLPRVHLGVALLGVVIIVPGIVSAIRMTGETMAKIGSFLTIASMLIFAGVVILSARRG